MKGNPSPANKMPAQAVETDPVLCKLDGVLDADPHYQQVCAKLDRLTGEAMPGEVLLRMLILKHLYQWSYKECEGAWPTALVLR
jgi:IS5 family transposase